MRAAGARVSATASPATTTERDVHDVVQKFADDHRDARAKRLAWVRSELRHHYEATTEDAQGLTEIVSAVCDALAGNSWSAVRRMYKALDETLETDSERHLRVLDAVAWALWAWAQIRKKPKPSVQKWLDDTAKKAAEQRRELGRQQPLKLSKKEQLARDEENIAKRLYVMLARLHPAFEKLAVQTILHVFRTRKGNTQEVAIAAALMQQAAANAGDETVLGTMNLDVPGALKELRRRHRKKRQTAMPGVAVCRSRTR